MGWIGQTGYYPANFNMNIDPYGSMSYMSTGTSNSNSSESSGSVKDIERKKKEENKSKKKDDVVKSELSTIFKGITKKEEKKIFEYAADKMEYHENLGTSLAFGAGLGLLLPNIGRLTQPFSTAKSAFSKNSWANVLFKDVVKKDIWKTNPTELQNAFAEVNKAEIRYNKWKTQSLFKRGYTDDEFLKLMDKMDDALISGNRNKILEATEALSQANKMKEGLISQGFNKVKTFFGRTPASTQYVDDILNNEKALNRGAAALRKMSNNTFKGALKNSIGGKIGVLFALTSLIAEFKYIKAAFKKGKDGDGIKQLGQSVAKAASSWGGYVIGDALGKWGGAKLGATIGTAICPALGTVIGAASGFVLGTIASWGLRKVTNSVVGDNIANPLLAKEEIDNLKCKNKNNKELVAQKESEQQQYLSNLLAQAQKDKNIDKSTMDALTKAAQAYAPLEQNPNLEQVA